MHFIRRFRRCNVCTGQDEINLLMTISLIYAMEIVYAINLLWIQNDGLFLILSYGSIIPILVAALIILLNLLQRGYNYNSQFQLLGWVWFTASCAVFLEVLLMFDLTFKLIFSNSIIITFWVLHIIASVLHGRHLENLLQKDIDNNNIIHLGP